MTIPNYHKKLLLTLTFLVYHLAFAQKPNRHYIDSVLLQKDTAFSLAQRIMYVVNGVPYDTLALVSVLATFEIKHLLDVIYYNGRKHGHYPFYGDAAIIVFAHNQRTKYKRKAFKAAKRFLSDNPLPAVLSIDKLEINQTLTNSTFNRLRLKDIMYIDTIQFKDNNQIRIWTRQ
jgi:hypothetical protein